MDGTHQGSPLLNAPAAPPLVTTTPPDDAPPRELAVLAGGYSLRYHEGPATLDLHALDGRLCLRMILAPEGPRIEVVGGSLALRAEREITISCRHFAVDASEGMALRSGGDLALHAKGMLLSEGSTQRIVARDGDLTALANDDIALDGERIRLNSPQPIVRR